MLEPVCQHTDRTSLIKFYIILLYTETHDLFFGLSAQKLHHVSALAPGGTIYRYIAYQQAFPFSSLSRDSTRDLAPMALCASPYVSERIWPGAVKMATRTQSHCAQLQIIFNRSLPYLCRLEPLPPSRTSLRQSRPAGCQSESLPFEPSHQHVAKGK